MSRPPWRRARLTVAAFSGVGQSVCNSGATGSIADGLDAPMSGQSQQETISFEVTALNGLFLHTVDIFLVGSGNISQFVFVTADAKTTALANGAGDTSLQIGPSFGGALESLFFTETLTVGGNAPSSSSSAMDDKFGAFTGVTEPATHSLLTLGLAGVGFMSRRKKGRAP